MILFLMFAYVVVCQSSYAFEVSSLSLKEAIQLALENNPQMMVSQNETSMAIVRRSKALSGYWPRWGISVMNSKSKYPSVWQTETQEGQYRITDRLFDLTTQITASLPTDGEIFTRFTTQRSSTTSSNVLFSPYYFSQLEFGWKQPLLRGYDWFGTRLGNSWSEFTVASSIQTRSKWEFMNAVAELVSRVEDAYRNLTGARQDLQARQKAVEIAKQQLSVVEQKIDAGLLVKAEAYHVQERLEHHIGEQLLAQQEYRKSRTVLMNLLGFTDEVKLNGREPDLELFLSIEPYPFSRADIVKMIRDQNLLLRIFQSKIQEKELEMRRKRNLLLPLFNLAGSFFLNGGSSPNFTGYGDSLDDLLDLASHGWQAGVNLEIPLGPSPQRYEYRQSVLEYRKVQYEYEAEISRILAQALSLYEEVQASYKLVEISQKTAELAQKKLEFEQKKFAAGLATSFHLLQFQQDLTDARLREVKSLIAFQNAGSQLDVLTGRTLEKFDIEVVQKKDLWVGEVRK